MAPSIPCVRGSGPHRGDQLVVHPGHQEAAEAPVTIRNAQRRKARHRQLARAVDQALQYIVDQQLRGDGQRGVADRLQCGSHALWHRRDDSFGGMPKLLLWTQVAICVFVLAGMVIAITKLA